MADSVDPDQMLPSAVSDMGLHCLQRLICPNRVIMLIIIICISNLSSNLNENGLSEIFLVCIKGKLMGIR